MNSLEFINVLIKEGKEQNLKNFMKIRGID